MFKALLIMWVCILSTGLLMSMAFIELVQCGHSDYSALWWCLAMVLPLAYVVSDWVCMKVAADKLKTVPQAGPKRREPSIALPINDERPSQWVN